MKYFIPTLVALCLPVFALCQDITGLWKGTMYNDSTKQSLPYEVLISKENGKYTGYSHSWFAINDKNYYGIKKVKVRVAKDGKIIIQDAELIDNNYPVRPDNVSQLNVLDLAGNGNEATLGGPFVTNRTKTYTELTGQISVKKVSMLTESKLLTYLQKNGLGNDVTTLR
jgi:hypothetical protein